MSVLDARVEPHPVASATHCVIERGDDRMTLRVRRMTGREVDHHRWVVGRQRHQVAPVRDLVGLELHPHCCRLDWGAARVVPSGIESEDRHVADVTPRREAGRYDRRSSDLATGRERGEVRHARSLERRCAIELGERDVRAAVGNEHQILHARAS